MAEKKNIEKHERTADVRATIDAVLVAAYRVAHAGGYAAYADVEVIAETIGAPLDLVEKIALFLERKGLTDYADHELDLTIEGILRAEEILRGQQPISG